MLLCLFQSGSVGFEPARLHIWSITNGSRKHCEMVLLLESQVSLAYTFESLCIFL